MDAKIIFAIIGIIILIIVIFITLKKTNTSKIRPTANKKQDIIDGYKKRLHHELLQFDGDQETIKSKRSSLLKEFNAELSRNIFFDKDEIREVILKLSKYD